MKRAHVSMTDKRQWGDGPWQSEPDELEFIDKATGYACRILRAWATGSLCGYVGVRADHPDYHKPYDDVNVEVHGGLSFAAHMLNEPALWWLGFDCAHFGDIQPRIRAICRDYLGWNDSEWGHERYRTIDYVREELARLAQQLAKRAK